MKKQELDDLISSLPGGDQPPIASGEFRDPVRMDPDWRRSCEPAQEPVPSDSRLPSSNNISSPNDRVFCTTFSPNFWPKNKQRLVILSVVSMTLSAVPVSKNDFASLSFGSMLDNKREMRRSAAHPDRKASVVSLDSPAYVAPRASLASADRKETGPRGLPSGRLIRKRLQSPRF